VSASPVPAAPPPPQEEATPTKKNKRGLVFGLCGLAALSLILLLILLPGKKGSPSAAPAGTEPPVVMETINPEVTPEPTSESTPETTPEPTPEPIVEPPEEPVLSPEELLAQGFQQMNDSTFWKLEDGVLTIAGEGAMEDYTFTTQPWKDNISSVQSIVVENGISSIGRAAFSYTPNLSSVTLPDSLVRIGEYAFRSSNIRTVRIPKNVSVIGVGAFQECKRLKSIELAEGNSNFLLLDGVLFSGDGKTLLKYPSRKEGESYSVPAGVSVIGHSALDFCEDLLSVSLPDSVTHIGEKAFYRSNRLRSISLPDSLEQIGYEAFGICTALTEITIPKGITKIESFTFSHCSSLTEVTVPDGVTVIDSYAFSDCTTLTSLRIPESVSSIGSNCCRGDKQLCDVFFAGSEAQWKAISFGKENDVLLSASMHFSK
jgi:hypothetical protein